MTDKTIEMLLEQQSKAKTAELNEYPLLKSFNNGLVTIDENNVIRCHCCNESSNSLQKPFGLSSHINFVVGFVILHRDCDRLGIWGDWVRV